MFSMRATRLTAAVVALVTAGMLAAAAPAVPVGAGAAPAPSGFRGEVTRGPTTPVCRVGIPCTAPAAGATLVFSHTGRALARVTADEQGRYRIELPAGYYTVGTGGSGRWAHRASPYRVKVRLAHVDRLDFFIDTGIR